MEKKQNDTQMYLKTLALSAAARKQTAVPSLSSYFPPAMAKFYIVSFHSNDDRRPSKFIVLADNMRAAIKMAWEHGGATSNRGSTKPPPKAEQI
jgi:hypothetical protein